MVEPKQDNLSKAKSEAPPEKSQQSDDFNAALSSG